MRGCPLHWLPCVLCTRLYALCLSCAHGTCACLCVCACARPALCHQVAGILVAPAASPTTRFAEMSLLLNFTVGIRCVDLAGLSASGLVAINVVESNDAPVVTPAVFSVLVNSAMGVVIGTVQASDPDNLRSGTPAQVRPSPALQLFVGCDALVSRCSTPRFMIMLRSRFWLCCSDFPVLNAPRHDLCCVQDFCCLRLLGSVPVLAMARC